MPNFQQTIIVGHVGKDPDFRTVGGKNTPVANFSVAVTTNKGKQNEHTEWFNVTAWQKTAEICRDYVKKGKPVMITGMMKTRKWQDQNGNDRYTTDLHAQSMQLLGDSGGSGGQSQREQRHAQRQAASQGTGGSGGHGAYDDFDDDIPFQKPHDEYFG